MQIEKEGNRVNATNLKLSVIDHSSLTEAQKISAAENLNTCLEADLSSSPALSIGSKAANMGTKLLLISSLRVTVTIIYTYSAAF